MMEFELLRSFVAVAECGGFHRAAERLNLTQSTVSQQIKRLELKTKRPLFRRTTRTVALTDDGEMLLGDARRLLQLEEAARRRLTAPPLSGTVRLGAVEEVAGGSLPPALGLFASSHPNVKLEVQIGVSSPLIEQLDAGRLDVVFAKRPLGTSRGRLVWREPMVWAAAEAFELARNDPALRRFPRLPIKTYTAMFVMPVSGFLYVMAGGYGVILFGVLDLANPIGKHDLLAVAAKWTHILSSYALLLVLAGPVGLVLRHQVLLKDRLLHRMLPSGRSP